MTYSIVARDPGTGDLGVAVQSHWFDVGGLVVAAEAGVGAIATQAAPNLAVKPRGLALLREGMGAEQVVAELVAGDDLAAHRQFAVVGTDGRAAAHTGAACMREAGHLVGDGFSVQANIMRSSAVWAAMHDAFEAVRGGGLTQGLLAALDAAEAAGGDLRGRQSAAILVVPAQGGPEERLVDLRVDDAPEPLDELRRLVRLNDAYALADAADQLAASGDAPAAADLYLRAFESAPEKVELRFWAGLGLVSAGRQEQGVALVRECGQLDDAWFELLRRLDPAAAPGAAECLRLLDE